jgi:hypothetical protein
MLKYNVHMQPMRQRLPMILLFMQQVKDHTMPLHTFAETAAILAIAGALIAIGVAGGVEDDDDDG